MSCVVQLILPANGVPLLAVRRSLSGTRRTADCTPANERHRDGLSASCRAPEPGWVAPPLRSALPMRSWDRNDTCLVPRYATYQLGDAKTPCSVAGNPGLVCAEAASRGV